LTTFTQIGQNNIQNVFKPAFRGRLPTVDYANDRRLAAKNKTSSTEIVVTMQNYDLLNPAGVKVSA
jgi:hypothetical protein